MVDIHGSGADGGGKDVCHEVMRPGGSSRPRRVIGVKREESCGSNSGAGVSIMSTICGEDDWGLSGGGEEMAEDVRLRDVERVVKGEGAQECDEKVVRAGPSRVWEAKKRVVCEAPCCPGK